MKNIFLRKRIKVLDEFEKGNFKLLFVKANAGFGKTSVIKDYFTGKHWKYIWVGLDYSDNDFFAFCSKLYRSMQQEDLLDICADPFWYQEGKLVNNIRNMINRLENIANDVDRYYIILDDFDKIENEAVFQFMETLFAKDMVKMGIVVLSRTDTCLLSRYILSHECFVIQEKHFSIKESETEKFYKMILGKERRHIQKTSCVVTEYFGGWPAGIYATLQYLQEHNIELKRKVWKKIMEETGIASYIRYEILEKLPEKQFAFLKQIALLEIVDEGICEEIWQINDAKLILDKLSSTCFFIRKEEKGYICLKAFRQLLLEYLEPEEIFLLLKKVFQYYKKRREYDRLGHYISELQYNEIIKYILEEYGEELYCNGQKEFCILGFFQLLDHEIYFSTKLLTLLAFVYNYESDRKYHTGYKEGEKVIIEQRNFFMNLLRYNDNRKQNKESLRCFLENFEGTKNEEKGLKINVFGEFKAEMKKDKRELSWRTKKTCELFALLHDLQGKPVERQVILDKLWQDGQPKNAIVMLHNMIYSIRKELAPYELEDIIVYENKCYFLNMKKVDTELLKINQICTKIREGNTDYIIGNEVLFRKYWGRYLGSMDVSWAAESREYYDKSFMNGLLIISRYYTKRGKYEQAVPFLKELLKLDNLQEEAITFLVYCYGRMGELKIMKGIYEKYSAILKKELNIEPCQNLRNVYRFCMEEREGVLSF